MGSSFPTILEIVQIILSATIVVLILLQSKGAGLGSVFGGTGAVFKTRRGVERLLFNFTIAFTILWGVVALLSVHFNTATP